jgi:hypothetical protein
LAAFITNIAGSDFSVHTGLEPVGENGKQQMAGQMRRRLLPEHTLPARPQAMEIEIAQMRDLVAQRQSGCFRGNRSYPLPRVKPHGSSWPWQHKMPSVPQCDRRD